MSQICIVIPCYNEEENVEPMTKALEAMMSQRLPEKDYDIIFIDNASTDGTQKKILEQCERTSRVKAIFNARNFGQFNSPYHALCESDGDCCILLACDFQDPIELIPTFVEEWERGYKIVCGIKTNSKENKIVRFFRTCYYKLIQGMSNVEQIEHFTGFGLYDREFLDVLRQLDDPIPFLRGIVAELGMKRKDIPYTQEKRKAGKTHNNWFTLYDAAMLSFTSYTKTGMRLAVFAGFCLSVLSIISALVYFVLKILYWDTFPAGSVPVLLAVLVFGSLQLFFLGLLGEYVMSINTRVMKRPLVVEESRHNF